MRLEEYINEAISSGKGKRKYHDEDIKPEGLANLECSQMIELLKDLEGKDIVQMWKGGSKPYNYGYDLTKIDTDSDLRYFHTYVKGNYKPGQVVWHFFGRASNFGQRSLVVVSLNPNNKRKALSEMFQLMYDSSGCLRMATTFYEYPSNNAVGGTSGILDSGKGTFSNTMDDLSEVLESHE